MKNRTVLGIICIVLAVAVTFVISPMVSKVSEKKTEVYRFAADVSLGSQIKEKDIEKVKVPGSVLPEKVIKTDKEIVGKYVTADIFKGDYLTESKISDTANSSKDVFASLKGDKVAMSITINSFAGGLSGKIQNGDIVSVYVTDKDKKTEVPPMLKYGGLLRNRVAMGKYCYEHGESGFDGSYTKEYGFRVDTDKYSYLMRVNPTKGDRW